MGACTDRLLCTSRLQTLPQPLLQILDPRPQPLHGRLIVKTGSNPARLFDLSLGPGRRILGEYIWLIRDANQTVDHLVAVLDRDEVVHALDRMNRRRILRLVE